MRNTIQKTVLVISVIGLATMGCQTAGTKGVTTSGSEKQRIQAPGFKVETYIPEKVQDGTTILADLHNPDHPKIIEVNIRGELVWEYVIPNHLLITGKASRGLDVEALPNGNVLFVLPFSGVYEVNRAGEIVWSHTEKATHDADRLPNGNTIMVMSWDRKDSAQVREVAPDGKVVWEWRAIDHFDKPPYNNISHEGWSHVNAVERLEDGNTLVSLRNFGLTVIVDPEGVVIKQYNWDDYGKNPHEPKILPNGNLLVAVRRPNIAFEFNPATGEKVWEFREKGVKTIRGLDRLTNGNILITGRTEVVEVTPNGEIVWHFHAENISRSRSDKGRWLYKAQRIE